MGTTMRLAIPSLGEGGLQAQRSGHFGRCDCFTVVTVTDGEIGEVEVISNPPHEEGGCLRPVALLADAQVDAIVAAGMGGRPFMGFSDAGITVYFDTESPDVESAARRAAIGETPIMGIDGTCAHHH